MPFILQDRRDIIDTHGLDEKLLPGGVQPGDICYYYYKPMVDAWLAAPRWTTANDVYFRVLGDVLRLGTAATTEERNHVVALDLAWQVFFQLHVMPYELDKMKENGPIGE